jgi:sec-independent protein translocase protein TatA
MFGGRIGWPEIVLILVIVLIIFGVGKLPQIGKSIGQSIREFKSATRDNQEEAHGGKPSDTQTAAAKENKS